MKSELGNHVKYYELCKIVYCKKKTQQFIVKNNELLIYAMTRMNLQRYSERKEKKKKKEKNIPKADPV